jgi:uncharacterized protein YukE
VSAVRGPIAVLQQQQLDRRRQRLQVEEMWDDAAARRYFDIVDELERADREYGRALQALDAALDHAARML